MVPGEIQDLPCKIQMALPGALVCRAVVWVFHQPVGQFRKSIEGWLKY
jgi:hypothetical protein